MTIPLLLACAGPIPPPGPPDVLIVTVDTLRADRLGFAGHPAARTPRLDRLAAGGTAFDEATTPFPRTTPALGSLHTGLLPVHHGSREVGDPVDADGRLAGWLAGAGWQTLGISAMKVAGPEQRMDVGFAAFTVDHDARAADLTRRALDAAAALDAARPALLWVHYADPHFPYLPEAPIDAPRCRALGEQAAAGKLARADLFANRRGAAEAVLDECRALYDGEVTAVDAAVGALLDGLDRVRPRSRLVVFTADHGENQGEDGLFFEHGPSLDDAAVRVPLLIAGPGVPVGRDGGVARLEDLAPTVLELLELPVPDGLDGLPLFEGPRAEVALIESGSALQVPLFRSLVSGRGDRWCLNEGAQSWCTLRGRTGLFDHDADPELRADVALAHPQLADRLREAATRWPPESAHLRLARTPEAVLRSVPSVDGWVRSGDPRLGPALDRLEGWIGAAAEPVAGEDEALRSLGYVE